MTHAGPGAHTCTGEKHTPSPSLHTEQTCFLTLPPARVSLPQHLPSALISINASLTVSKVQETQPNLLRPEQALSARNTQNRFTAHTERAMLLWAGLQTSAIITTQRLWTLFTRHPKSSRVYIVFNACNSAVKRFIAFKISLCLHNICVCVLCVYI